MPNELSLQDPYRTVGRQFSADGWVHGAADVLRGKLQDPELAHAAAECLNLMSHRRDWMRCWAMFDALPVLVYVSQVRLSPAWKCAFQPCRPSHPGTPTPLTHTRPRCALYVIGSWL